LIQSAKLNGHDPHAYRKDVMEKLPTWRNSRIEALLPHRWQQGAQIRGLSLLGVGFHRRVTTVKKTQGNFQKHFQKYSKKHSTFHGWRLRFGLNCAQWLGMKGPK
jgi:hypothetical protein